MVTTYVYMYIYIYIYVTLSRFRNVNESTMRMLISLWRVLFSDNAAAWTNDFWAEPNDYGDNNFQHEDFRLCYEN